MKIRSGCCFCLLFGLCLFGILFSAPSVQTALGKPPATENQPTERKPTAAELDFFEKEVRPLLLSACSECHGAETQWGNLRVDSRSSLLKGGDTGAAIIPGDADNSLLISSVRRTGDYEMPPEAPLSAAQVAVLERWVEMGAPWPAGDELPANEREKLWQTHWAFQPLSRPVPPEVSQPEWCQTPVDRFILAKLEAAQLAPSAPADRRSLIRRVTYSLTGLPPTAAEVQAFVNNEDPEAYTKLVDRLLASPHYGEHWGRHWLDLARYADTKGYVYGREENRFVHSWGYRNWVVQAFNEDLPYDRFLLLQLAADQAAAEDAAAQAALGFLTIGRRFLGNTPDILDDRIDVLSRTTMGLTVACSRCHDHKYDPIPTADYYSLYGIFQNCTEHLQPTQPLSSDNAAAAAFMQELQARQEKLNQGMAEQREVAAQRVRARITDYLQAQLELEKYPDISFSQILQPTDLIPAFVHQWEAFLRSRLKADDPVFLAWHRFLEIPEAEFAKRAPAVAKELQESGSQVVHPLVAALFAEPPASRKEVAERYGKLFTRIDQEWQSLLTETKLTEAQTNEQDAPAAFPDITFPDTVFPDTERETLRAVLYGPMSPCTVPDVGIIGNEFYFDTGTTVALWELQKQVDQWLITSPDAPAFAVTLKDRELIQEPRIFRRGNPATKGEEVPRQTLQILADGERQPFSQGSGRLELAREIIAPDNPLTARVWVNRIWGQHFGTGLVPTTSDFGTRAPTPAHLELLDWLAQKLLDEGWSTKAIQRQILLSAAYQQQSTGPADINLRERAEQLDPENSLLWKQTPHRLTFEEMRDSLLKVSGELNTQPGGRGEPLFAGENSSTRRTLYGFIDRQLLPNVYRVFDFANPDLHIPHRSETMISQQALFAMNHPFPAERARALVQQLGTQPELAPEKRVDWLYRQIYQRSPTTVQTATALAFLENAEVPQQPTESLAWQYGYGPINPETGGIQSFTPLPHYSGAAWQGGANWPDAKLGWAQLTADGGHPGNDHKHAVIRRWTAPLEGTITLRSLVKHEVAAGNGIRCWIISSRQGVLHRAELHNASQELNVAMLAVQTGDTLDFVVDINGNLNNDQYLWQANLQLVTDTNREWNSSRDFAGSIAKFLSPWEQLTQVLLLSNEFYFVD